MKRLLAGLVFMALSACASVERYEQSLDTWLGKSEKELVSTWGVPDKTYQIDTSTKMIAYIAQRTITHPGTPPRCDTRFSGDRAFTDC